MRVKAILLCFAAVLTGCMIYPSSPLFTGRFGATSLVPGRYTGVALCNRYFQSVNRPGTLDTLELPLTVDIGAAGKPVWSDGEVVSGSSFDLPIGVFTLRRVARNIATQASSLTVSYEAGLDVFDDQQRPVELAGSGAEVYTTEDEGRLGMSLSVTLQNADPAQTGMTMSFECTATLEPG